MAATLYLAVTGPGAAKWTFRFMRAGKADPDGDVGVLLADARAAAT